MKRIFFPLVLAITSTLFFTSCKNDLDVLAPGKETISVYGVLNPNEVVQFIRINKVYLTDGDALVAAQNASDINYGAGELTVTLQRFTAGSTTPTLTTIGDNKTEIVLTETVITTQDGMFNQNQRIWQTSDKLYSTGQYKISVKNNNTGAQFTAQSVVLDSIKSTNSMPFIYYPHPNPDLAYPMHGGYVTSGVPGNVTNKRAYVDYSATNITQKIRFYSIPNAKLYSVIMRFHYIDSLIGGAANHRYADYTFPTIESNTLNGGEPLEASFLGNSFYTNMASIISKNNVPNLKNRRAFYLEYIIYAGAQSLFEFLQVNAPSTTIAQDKPYYTNINGGVGVFSSKSRSTVTKDLWSDFINKIACHPSTFPLLFCNSAGVTVPVACN